MFNRSFKSFLKKDIDNKELYPYLYTVNFKGLKEAKKVIITQPIKCSQCGAVLTNVGEIKQDDKIGTHFTCVFCGAVNVISKEMVIPEGLTEDVDYILEDVQAKESSGEKITGVSATEGELYISVIDISGSMSGGKIQAVKKSLIQTLKDFKVNAKNTKYILIPFESSVNYYLKPEESVTFQGDLLFSTDTMKAKLKDLIATKKAEGSLHLGSLGEFADSWIKMVENLRPMDMTALGPALYFAIVSFELLEFKSGRITLLTDGLANQGIGNLSGTSPGAEKFYETMAMLCNQNDLIIDVVGVSSPGDNNEMGLEVLGKLTDNTGGKLYLISSEEMEQVFTELRQTNYIGKDVVMKMMIPKKIGVKNITGAFSSKAVKEAEVNLGAVTEDRELYVELEEREKLKEEEIPVQLQVHYKDNEGRKRLRVINDKVKVSDNQEEFIASYDHKLNVMMNIQSAGSEYYSGNAQESKTRLKKLKKSMRNERERLKQSDIEYAQESYDEGFSYLKDELEEMKMEEERLARAPAKSFMAAAGQSKARMSMDDLQKRIKSKKKLKK